MTNPFTYDRPLAPDALIDRGEEAGLLLALAEAGQSARLTAPRRYGKTTLLGYVARQARKQHGFVATLVDFSHVVSVADVVVRLRNAYEEGLTGPAARLWQSLKRRIRPTARVGVPGIGSVSATLADRQIDELSELHGLLDVPAHVFERAGKRCLVVFDEFQDLMTVPGELDGVLRSHLQHQTGAASYIFAGSHEGMMAALFGDRRRPLFEQARAVGLGPLADADLAEWIDARFLAGQRTVDPAVMDTLLAQAAGHPQRAMMLAHFLWEQTTHGKTASFGAWDRALEATQAQASDGLEQTWRGLSPNQRRALATVAGGHRRLLSSAALAASQLSKSSMRDARDSLLAQGDLLTAASGEVSLADSLLAPWLAGTH